MATENETCQIFDNLLIKFSCLLYGRSDKHQQQASSLLDELNSLNYKLPFITNNNKAVLLIHQICTVIPPTDTEVVKKCCVLIINLIIQQRISIEVRTLSFSVNWIIQILKQTENPDISILQCLESLIRDNVDKVQEHLPELIGDNGLLLKYSKTCSIEETQLWAVKCLEAITYSKEEQSFKDFQINVHYLETCFQVFQTLVSEDKLKCNEVICSKLLISCLRGLQSIIIQNSDFESYDLGTLLGISKYYMAYYLFESNWIKPQKIMPSNLSVADLKTNAPREKKGGKVTKQRKQRKSNPHKKEDKRNDKSFSEQNNLNYTPATNISDNIPIVISDSDVSDSETGKSNKISISQGRVRQAALNMLLSIVKVTDKHVMFGYWSSFFHDGSPSNIYTLNNCFLQEPSPRGRIAILNVISTILNGSKLYLSHGETSEKTFAFTPFSMILGSMIQELHQCLCLSLKDNSIPVLTQTLKSLALLIQASPYHRLSPGLLVNVISNVKLLIRHRDTTVQVAALIVLGCVVASEPIIPETISNLSQKNDKTLNTPLNTSLNESDQEIEYAAFSSDEENIQVPETNENIPWLLEKCLRNLGVVTLGTKKNIMVPAPVKLESLQVISALCRNYFHVLLEPHLILVAKAIEISLGDKYIDLRLHAGRAVDSIGHAMQQISSTDEFKSISIDKSIQFWQILLNGPLTSLLQNDQSATLRSIGCDCLGSIRSEIFEQLPKDKQLLIITLLFTCSRDEENSVKGAAVRALAICVLFPSLREDLGFVMDTAEAIIRTLNDNNVTVRIKSSWSLGNLSDALVLYMQNPTNEDLPDSLLHKLLFSCIKIFDDNNKIKSNAVRALGNLLRLITVELLKRDHFKEITEQAISILVKSCISCSDMKVRWNSCYAIGNFMKNNELFTGNITWQKNIYPVLMDLVSNCRNFKVRINAALALSIPEKRNHFGNYYFSIWKSLLNAIDNTQNIEDFNEFKHRVNLIDQICLSISHVATFLQTEDLNKLNELMVCHIDELKIQMHRVHERLVPEKSKVLLKAADHIKDLKVGHLTNEQQVVLIELENIFTRKICI